MKKLATLILVSCLIMSSCGIQNKIEQKIGEKVAEKVLESTTGGNVDISDEGITFKDEEGREVTMGDTKWPNDLKHLPEFNDGVIVSVIKDSNGNAYIIINEVKEKDFKDYYDQIKNSFPDNPYELTMDSVVSYTGNNGENFGVVLTYDSNDGTMSIGVEQKTE